MTATGATVGREAELTSIVSFIDSVPTGATALVLTGEAGIGKTILWEHGVAMAHQTFGRVLTCRGIEAESSLSFATLSELIAPTFGQVAANLVTPRRNALEVALRLVDPGDSTPDPLTIGLAVLDAIRTLATEGPLVLALDDAQWMDPASGAALQIAVRRLGPEPIGLLVTVRDSRDTAPIDLERALGPSRMGELRIGPLSVASLHQLMHDQFDLDLTRPQLVRLREMTRGNPFFALEVGREMVRTKTRTADLATMRVSDTLREQLGGRLARLPPEFADVLLIAAAAARPTLDLLVSVHGDRSGVMDALDLATREGLMTFDDDRVRFAHPLHASLCYQQAPAHKRREVHQSLAEAVSDLEERARHLARAADGPDAAVASELEAAAKGAALRGALEAGAELYELAAQLTVADPALTQRRLLHAASFQRLTGNNEHAITLLEQLRTEMEPGPGRADVLAELVATRGFDNPTMVALCDEALEEAGADDRRAARVLVQRADAHQLRGDMRLALRDGRLALERAERANDPVLTAVAIGRIGDAELYAGEITPGLTERGVAIERRLGLALEYLTSPRKALARRQMRMGELDEAHSILEEIQAEATARGDERIRADTLQGLSVVEWYRGRWRSALEYARQGCESMDQTQDAHGRAVVTRAKAIVEADLGLVEDGRASAEEAIAAAVAMSDDFMEVSSIGVLGRIELMLGNMALAANHFDGLLSRLMALGVNDPILAVWPDAVETLIAVGDPSARPHLEHWERRASLLQSPLALATTARCRGLLDAAASDFPHALGALDQSLQALEGFTYPLERARTLLCMGSVLRQAQQRGAARDALQQALTIFEELGGRLWADKARAELARISGRRPPSEVLTGTERQVAELAGAGESNKEIAASLHMGVSTVEAHLSTVYRKLDVRRAGLAARLAEL